MPTRPDSFTLDSRSRTFINDRSRPTPLNPKGLSRSFVLRSAILTYGRLLEGALPQLTPEEWRQVFHLLRDVDLGLLEHGDPPDLYALLKHGSNSQGGPTDEALDLGRLWQRLHPATPLRAVALVDFAHRFWARAQADGEPEAWRATGLVYP